MARSREQAPRPRLQEAKLKLGHACLEDIDYRARRELDKAVIRQLATCRWVAEHQNVLITGATGIGKTYLACALAQQACRNGFRASTAAPPASSTSSPWRAPTAATAALLAKLARVDVLVLDDWGLAPAARPERRDLLEILEDRYGTRSTIITSQLPPTKWHDYLGDPTVADAICDRVLHNAHRLVLQGPSRRKEDQARQLTDPSVAPLRSRYPIWVFTISDLGVHVRRNTHRDARLPRIALHY